MSATAIRDEPDLNTIMNAIILYDESALAADANVMLERAANRADATEQWTVKPWRLDLLFLPATADAALQEAAEAHLLLFAIREQAELPLWLLNWLEDWAERRQVQDAALAIFHGGDDHPLAAKATPGLSRFAEHHGLSFIFGDVNPVADEAAVFASSLHEREVAMTPTLLHIQKLVESGYQHSGLNE